jgi:hypothetical protein
MSDQQVEQACGAGLSGRGCDRVRTPDVLGREPGHDGLAGDERKRSAGVDANQRDSV